MSDSAALISSAISQMNAINLILAGQPVPVPEEKDIKKSSKKERASTPQSKIIHKSSHNSPIIHDIRKKVSKTPKTKITKLHSVSPVKQPPKKQNPDMNPQVIAFIQLRLRFYFSRWNKMLISSLILKSKAQVTKEKPINVHQKSPTKKISESKIFEKLEPQIPVKPMKTAPKSENKAFSFRSMKIEMKAHYFLKWWTAFYSRCLQRSLIDFTSSHIFYYPTKAQLINEIEKITPSYTIPAEYTEKPSSQSFVSLIPVRKSQILDKPKKYPKTPQPQRKKPIITEKIAESKFSPVKKLKKPSQPKIVQKRPIPKVFDDEKYPNGSPKMPRPKNWIPPEIERKPQKIPKISHIPSNEEIYLLDRRPPVLDIRLSKSSEEYSSEEEEIKSEIKMESSLIESILEYLPSLDSEVEDYDAIISPEHLDIDIINYDHKRMKLPKVKPPQQGNDIYKFLESIITHEFWKDISRHRTLLELTDNTAFTWKIRDEFAQLVLDVTNEVISEYDLLGVSRDRFIAFVCSLFGNRQKYTKNINAELANDARDFMTNDLIEFAFNFADELLDISISSII